MSNLKISPIFQELTCTFGDQIFSTMYFGWHCGKNVFILQHDFTIMLAFGDVIQWSAPELIKTVSFREEPVKGIQIVGNGDVILLMDENGNLWRLVNAFDSSDSHECLHSLSDSCFYEWVLFKKFNFVKVLALTKFGHGFACLGLCQDFKRKLLVLPAVDSVLEDYTFDELNMTGSLNYYLLNLNISVEHSVFKSKLTPTKETLIVSDRLSGRTYLCSKNRMCCLINQSNILLISTLDFSQEKCLALCLENGKLVFYFYNESQSNCTVHLSKKIFFIEKCCCCCDSCLLWSDGIILYHTKLTFVLDQSLVKLSHLELSCNIENPLSLLQISHFSVTVTFNNIYYLISAGESSVVEIKKQPKELLSQISQFSDYAEKLESKTDMLSHYLFCKDLVQKNKIKEKMEIRSEGNRLIIKSSLGVCLKQEFWKVKLRTLDLGKELVHMINLECDLCEGMCISVENPFKGNTSIKVTLIGYFEGKILFFDLGAIEKSDNDFGMDCVSKNLKKILKKKNPYYIN